MPQVDRQYIKCRNKKCQKILPTDYKHRYCEACRNKQANTVKRFLSAAGAAVLTGVGVLFTGGKINRKQ